MAQNDRHEQGRQTGGRGPQDGNAERFRGEMERDRTDGGFMPAERGDAANSGHQRWNEGRSQGAEFGRDRDDRHMEYGDPRYGASGAQGSHAANERHHGAEHREYRAWREEQMRRCDEEYGEYCRERQAKFNDDFEGWRTSRPTRGSRVDLGGGGGDLESPTSVRGASNDTIQK